MKKSQEVYLSSTLFTNQGFGKALSPEESINMIFFAGYSADHPLREFLTEFELTGWDQNQFASPQIGAISTSGVGSVRTQEVTVKLIYRRESALDRKSFDSIPCVIIDLERKLPPNTPTDVDPTEILNEAPWRLVRVRSYKSPAQMHEIISKDFS